MLLDRAYRQMAAPAIASVFEHHPSGSPLIAVAPERNLDFLRAVAVLLVVVCHLFGVSARTRAWPLPHELGTTGVLIFFVHTSLVLMLSMQRMKHPGDLAFASTFYVRRFFRIYPLSIVTVTLVFSLGIPERALAVFEHPTKLEWISNLLLFQNLARARSAIAPLWSLPWEVQMYVALPVIFILLNRIRYRAAVIVSLSLVAGLLSISGWNVVFKLLTYTPCFFGGVLAYVLLRSKPNLSAKLWPAAMLILLSGYLSYRLWAPQAEYPAWLLCTALGLAIPQFRDLAEGPLTKAAHAVAKYSYGIYLAHVPVIWLAFDHFRGLPVPARVLIFLAGVVGVPFLAYHLIEAPMIGIGKRFSFGSVRPASQ